MTLRFQSTRSTTATLLALLATGAIATSSWAQSTVPAMGSEPMADKPAAGASASTDKPMTEKVMTNKEMQAAFTKADSNKDGKLDKMEAEGVPGLVARFEQIDTDADKMITKSEFNKAIKSQ
jgi:hypothetical protein